MHPNTLQEIKVETKADPVLSTLCEFVAHGCHLTNYRFQRHSATTIRYGMS